MTTTESNPEPRELTSEERLAVVRELGLSLEAEFVPWSQSRNREEKDRSLNWRVTAFKQVERRGETYRYSILTTDYSAGCGHAPSYKAFEYDSYTRAMRSHAVNAECETGFRHRLNEHFPERPWKTAEKIEMRELDFWYSLALEADVLDYRGFEEWAEEFGYDTDSRRAERIYNECVKHAIALRAAIGDDGLRKLRAAFYGY